MLHAPSGPTTTVPSTVVPFGAYRVIVSPAAPVPLIAGLAFLVILSVWLAPVSLIKSCVRPAVGAAGIVGATTTEPVFLVPVKF